MPDKAPGRARALDLRQERFMPLQGGEDFVEEARYRDKSRRTANSRNPGWTRNPPELFGLAQSKLIATSTLPRVALEKGHA
jgi:hypothetical protein